MIARRRNIGAERGVTLVEAAISMTVLAGLVLVLGKSLDTGLGSYRSTSPVVVEQLAHRSVEKIAARLSYAGIETLQLEPVDTPDGSVMKYQQCLGSAAGEKVWSEVNYLEWREERDDPTDGVDNDGDGAVDEGMIVLLLDAGLPTQETVVLARGVARYLQGEEANGADDNGNGHVDERGFLLEIKERYVQVHLTLVRQGRDGELIERTARAVVAMRN